MVVLSKQIILVKRLFILFINPNILYIFSGIVISVNPMHLNLLQHYPHIYIMRNIRYLTLNNLILIILLNFLKPELLVDAKSNT